MTNIIPVRTPYQGLLQIFRYNRQFYTRTLAMVVVVVTVAMWLPFRLRALLLLAGGVPVFWMCSSLLVSHYIYDRSPLYGFRWLKECLSRPPARWANIHSGIDETSRVISSMFPGSQGQIFDIYDPREMTEPSIEEARRIANAPFASTDWRALPAPDKAFDAAFLIFSAHELRRHEARVQLFREVDRILRIDGELVLVEHLRDVPNFLAFGPGFFHFFSGRTWRRAANAVGFRTRLHRSVTPFVHVFVLGRPA